MKAFAAVVFIIFLVLLLEYNSFYQVLVTLSTVAMSIAGVMLGLHLLNMTFSFIMTGLGIVALAGIVVKNGIVLIDTYNHYRRDDHVEPVKAMLITAAQRVRPVLLTATVTALGVIPMALNVEFDFRVRLHPARNHRWRPCRRLVRAPVGGAGFWPVRFRRR